MLPLVLVSIVLLAVAAVLLMARSPGPTPSRQAPTEADMEVLAQDAHVTVGEVPLVLPFVAIPEQVSMGQVFTLDRTEAREEWRQQRDAFRAAASDASTAPAPDHLDVSISTYGSGNDENVEVWKTLCPRLTREWARSVCDDPWAPLQQALPGHFYLLDGRHPEALRMSLSWDGRYQTLWDVFALRPDEPALGCDPEPSERRLCVATQPIENHLVALWLVGDQPGETAGEVAAREGRAIRAFVRLALGVEERFAELEDIACAMRRPGSEAGLVRDHYACEDL